jgi:RimJ/RimL family protein N-acetyltransferase
MLKIFFRRIRESLRYAFGRDKNLSRNRASGSGARWTVKPAGGKLVKFGSSNSPMKAKIQLRDVAADDLPMFFEDQRDPIAVAMVAFNSRDRAAFDQHWAKILADDSSLKKTVLVDGEVAGNIVSWMSEEKREVGYWINRAFWGRGVATEALSAFLCLEQTRPLYAAVAKHNVASIRVLQKCGFTITRSVDATSSDGSLGEVSNDDEASHVLLTLIA